MKILLLHQFFVLDSDPGGTRHIFLSRFFCRKGAEVRVIAGSVNYMTGRSRLPFARLWENEIVDGIRITWIYALPTLKYGLVGKLACYFSFLLLAVPFALKEKADVLMATSPPPTVAFLGWLCHWLRGMPWVFEVRDLWPEVVLELGVKPGPLARFLDWGVRFLYGRASFIVPLTPGLARSILEKGIPDRKVRVITNGVDPIFVECSDPAPAAVLEKKDKFRVLYVGSMGIANALVPLLSAAEALKNDPRIEFLLVGDGSEKKRLLREATRRSLSNVKFLDPVTRIQVPSLLREGDVGILTFGRNPSFRSLLPNRIFDYLAAGKPVILALSPGDAFEVLERSGGGIRVDPEDVEGIRKAILFFVDHPEEARRMGEKGRSHMLRHYLRENLAETYHGILQNLLTDVEKVT